MILLQFPMFPNWSENGSDASDLVDPTVRCNFPPRSDGRHPEIAPRRGGLLQDLTAVFSKKVRVE